MELKDWINGARTSAGLTMEQLGERVGRTKGNISGWVNGTHEPGWSQIVAVSKATRYPLWLLDEELLGPPVTAPAREEDTFRQMAYALVRDWAADGNKLRTRQQEFLSGFIAAVEAELAKSAAMKALTVTKSLHTEGGEVGKYEM